MTPASAGGELAPIDIDRLLDRAVSGVPRWRRARTRRELAGYVEDAFADLMAEGVDAAAAFDRIFARFGNPDRVAAAFCALPPPRWTRGFRASAAPMGMAVLGLVIGLTLVQLRSPPGPRYAGLGPDSAVLASVRAAQDPSALLQVRQVPRLSEPSAVAMAREAGDYQVASRLGVARSSLRVLEPSVPALLPSWLPDGYHPARGALFLTSSATVQFFADERRERAGIVIEVLRPDRSSVFQVKERHVFPVQVGVLPGVYIDGEWEVRGPIDEQPAPATWRTDRSHSVLFARDGLLVLVAGPADAVDVDDLLRIARSLR